MMMVEVYHIQWREKICLVLEQSLSIRQIGEILNGEEFMLLHMVQKNVQYEHLISVVFLQYVRILYLYDKYDRQ